MRRRILFLNKFLGGVILARLTKKRKSELLKQYPDGYTIGRVIIEDYLNGERNKRGVKYNSKMALSNEEIAFLISTISTEKDRNDYHEQVQFRDGIYTLMNIVSCLDNLFFCGYFRVLGLIQPIIMGLEVYNLNPDFLSNQRYKKKFKALLKQLEKELLQAWENMAGALRGLYFYDFILYVIGEIYDFNFDVIRPDLENRTDGFLNIQDEIHNLSSLITDYREITRGRKNRITISDQFITLLNETAHQNYQDLIPKSEYLEDLIPALKEADINIPTVHAIMNIMSDTPLQWR